MPDDEQSAEAWTAEVAKVVGRQVAYYRELRKMSAQQLSDALAAIGVSMKRPVISNLENGYRNTVSVAEVLALAAALNTPAVMLIFPLGTERVFPLLPNTPYHPDEAERWFNGNTTELPPAAGEDREVWLEEVERLRLLRQHFDLVEEWLRLQAVLDGRNPAGSNPRRVEFAADRSGEIERELVRIRRQIRREKLQPVALPNGLTHLDEDQP